MFVFTRKVKMKSMGLWFVFFLCLRKEKNMKVFTLKEAEDYLGVSRNTLLKNLDYNNGKIKTFRMGESSVRILEAELNKFMNGGGYG